MATIALPKFLERVEKAAPVKWVRVVFFDRAIQRGHVGLMPDHVVKEHLGYRSHISNDSKMPLLIAAILGSSMGFMLGAMIGFLMVLLLAMRIEIAAVIAVLTAGLGAGVGLPMARFLKPPNYYLVFRELFEQDDQPMIGIDAYEHSQFGTQEYEPYKYERDEEGRIVGFLPAEDFEDGDFYRKPSYTGGLFAEASRGEDFKQEFKTPFDESVMMKLQLGLLALILMGLAVIVYLMFANATAPTAGV